MKMTPPVAKAIDPAKPVHSTPGDEDENLEALSLSPDAIADRASTTTSVLNEILERNEASYAYRYWGINE